MKITYHGHACFSVKSVGYTVVLDPYKGVDGFDDINLTANKVLCSHEHFDHAYTDGVKIVGTYSPFKVSTYDCFHDDCNGEKRGGNKVTILEAEGKKVVHLGDLGHMLSDEIVADIKDCSALMIPVGGFYTINSKQAAELVNIINPRIIIPMHYKDDKKGIQVLEDVDSFINKLQAFQRVKLALVKGYDQSIEI